jgi:tetratricopeptide (TPR) repeat protein
MSRRSKRNDRGRTRGNQAVHPAPPRDDTELQRVDGLPRDYWQACELAQQGNYGEARRLYSSLVHHLDGSRLSALVQNDLAVLAAMEGRVDEACEGWRQALNFDQGCLMARLNRDLLHAEFDVAGADEHPAVHLVPPPDPIPPPVANEGPIRVAILSFLFNWPSTGGGNMHTAGMAEFLGWTGFDVRHFYARFPDWGIGRVAEPLVSSEAIEFDAGCWNIAEIQARYRRAVDRFNPGDRPKPG